MGVCGNQIGVGRRFGPCSEPIMLGITLREQQEGIGSVSGHHGGGFDLLRHRGALRTVT